MADPEQTISELHASALEQLELADTSRPWKPCAWMRSAARASSMRSARNSESSRPEERKHVGKLLNTVKQDLEARLEARKAALESEALDARLASEWIDLTTPAPGVRPGSLHPVTQVQRELEELFVSTGFRGSGRARSRDRNTTTSMR